MKRKLISLLLVLVLCLSMTVSVRATSDTDFVVDESGYLAPGELEELNSIASSIYENTGLGVFFVFTDEDPMDYYVGALIGDVTDYYVMIEGPFDWIAVMGGGGEVFEYEAKSEIRSAYDAAETYVDGVRDYLTTAANYIPVPYGRPMPIGDELENDSTAAPETTLLFDEAGLLTAAEAAALDAELDAISSKYNAEITITTVSSLGGADIDEYIEYYYDSMGFGYGSDHDGVMLLVAMDVREFRILSNGFAAKAITSGKIDSITDTITPDLSAGNYADAFSAFIEECDYNLDGHVNGFPFKFGKNILIAVIIGLVLGLIVALILKGQLKSVRKQNQANVYVKPGSMQITTSNDLFLYRNVTRTKKASNNSSGSSRNVGGGKF